MRPIGNRAYSDLLSDLLEADKTWQFDLGAAPLLAPKKGGINIEGLAATTDGRLLIGFRSPMILPKGTKGKPLSLVVPLLNPRNLVDQYQDGYVGAPVQAQFGQPVLIDLDSLGIRSIELVGDKYFVIGGNPLEQILLNLVHIPRP